MKMNAIWPTKFRYLRISTSRSYLKDVFPPQLFVLLPATFISYYFLTQDILLAMAPLVWFITGASSGLGLSLSLYALTAGHYVIGTVRNAAKSADAVQAFQDKGGKIVELDVTKADAIPEAVKQAESFYGKIDVLVNNAGYSLLGAVEDLK